MPSKVRKRPCASCPYRRDVPSGLWAASEYDSLRRYDGEAADQVMAGALEAFGCHQTAGDELCAGWAGHRDPADLIALRIAVAAGAADGSALTYSTDVPLFASGAEAADHGKREIDNPPETAREAVSKIATVREMRGAPVKFR